MAEPRALSQAAPSMPRAANSRSTSGGEWMASVPSDIRGRIRSGMRWTVWLSVLAIPFSYGSSVLLARTSPETIGTYGLLTVYIGLVSSVLYLGGDAVAFKFLPELDPSRRSSFVFSYFFVICASLVPYLVLAVLFPRTLHYLFGRGADEGFLLLVLCLAPLPILFSLVRAVMKADLDFKRPQLLARMVTIGSFIAYAMLFLFERHWLASHPVEIIWSIYLALTTLGIAAGLYWLRTGSFLRDPRKAARPRFWLPRGFWSYALGTEQISLVGFFLQRLDYILVLNFGGLKLLGEYVAITTLALSIPLVTGFFYDTLLPSLTNLLAAGDPRAAGEVFRAHMRLFLVVIAVGSCGLIFLASPLLAIFGPAYRTLTLPVVALSTLVGLACPGATGGTLLSAIGKPQRAVWVNLFQVAAFVGLFLLLWPRLALLGAALALGISMLAGNLLLFAVGRASASFAGGVARDYARFALVVGAAGLAAWRWTGLSLPVDLLAWALSLILLLVVGNYRWTECHNLWCWVVPSFGDRGQAASAVSTR